MADALQATQRLQDSLSAPIELAGREVFVSASIGIAFGPERYRHADEVLRDADTAMYRAKTMGRGRHVPFDAEMHLRAVGRLGVESELRRAIERREFELHYQPIVALEARRIHTVEGLLRWQHPERGLLAPSEFIGVAEDTGLIVPMVRPGSGTARPGALAALPPPASRGERERVTGCGTRSS